MRIGTFDTLVEHWDGERWRKVRHPTIDSEYVEVGGVAAVSSNDAWIVGSYLDEGASAPLALHWNGSRWRRTTPVRPDGLPAVLRDVAVDASGQVWAVGQTTDATGSSDAMVQRWTGRRWKVVPTPDVDGTRLDSVSGGPHGVWAVGSRQTDQRILPVIMKWAPRQDQWKSVAAPAESGDNMLLAVDQSPGAQWAVGFHGFDPRLALGLRRC
jgi:hypothetical protein